MVEFLGKSRIDGYPLVKIPNNSYGEQFVEYFRRKTNFVGNNTKVDYISSLNFPWYDNKNQFEQKYFIVKIALDTTKFNEEFDLFRKNIRKQKLIQINGIK